MPDISDRKIKIRNRFLNIADLINEQIGNPIFFLVNTNTKDICFKSDDNLCYLMFEVHPFKKFKDNYLNIKDYLPNRYDGCYDAALDFFDKANYKELDIRSSLTEE
ncbi:hypothetical protein GF361_01770 [Candidatus Woesearchaeota archaeon]|nr:hypothetical protein [Candidatus Woesearchaeota archaeon]